jgi:hypothetical protein
MTFKDSMGDVAADGFFPAAAAAFLILTCMTPLSSSIILMIWAWSEASIGATEMSRTARNLPVTKRGKG